MSCLSCVTTMPITAGCGRRLASSSFWFEVRMDAINCSSRRGKAILACRPVLSGNEVRPPRTAALLAATKAGSGIAAAHLRCRTVLLYDARDAAYCCSTRSMRRTYFAFLVRLGLVSRIISSIEDRSYGTSIGSFGIIA